MSKNFTLMGRESDIFRSFCGALFLTDGFNCAYYEASLSIGTSIAWFQVISNNEVVRVVVFSNRKMRLKYFKSCGGFGSTVNRLKQSFSSLLYFVCSVIIA